MKDIRDIESLLQKFQDGMTTEEEEALLAGFISEGDTGIFDDFCRSRWMNLSEEVSPEVKERIRARLMNQVDDTERRERKKLWKRRSKIFLQISVAATVLLATVLAGWHIAQDRNPEIFSIVAERGQKSSITLPDGSRVWLNSASTISYTSDYNSRERNVFLKGEAYFDVAKNPEIPFIVHSQNLSVEALGTKFNIRAYEEDPVIVTTLVEGMVRTTAGNVSDMLYPEQESSFDKQTGLMHKTRVQDPMHMIPWLKNEILFTDSSLSEIALLLERMYNVTVKFDDEKIGDFTYTGLVRNNSLQNVLELISTTSPVTYVIEENTVAFSAR